MLLIAVLMASGCGSGAPHRLVGSGMFAPAITMLSPGSAPVGSGTFTMTVVGSNFGPDAVVFWNGQPASTMLVNSHQIMAQITAVDLQDAGLVPVFVRTAGLNSNTVNFDVLIQ